MPPIAGDATDFTQFYDTYGADLGIPNGSQAVGDCPSCGKVKKFCVNIHTGQFSCKSCQFGGPKGGGNVYTFMKALHAEGKASSSVLEILRKERGLLSTETLRAWKVTKCNATGEWIIPTYNLDGTVLNLYRYVKNKDGRRVLYSSPELHQQLFGLHLWKADRPEVWICEGPWDAMAVWELLGHCRRGNELSRSPVIAALDEKHSFLETVNVIAVPGAGTWNDSAVTGWTKLLSGKKVTLLYDNDHPREVEGKTVEGAALTGMKRLATILTNAPTPAKEIHYLHWGPSEAEVVDTAKKTGWDVRDELVQGGDDTESRVSTLGSILKRCRPVPEKWITGRSIRSYGGVKTLSLLKCEEWKVVRDAWGKAMFMHEGMDRGLACMLAVVLSTEMAGDQLWMKIVGPPSCGKTKLAEGLMANLEFVESVSQLTGFHSGYKEDKKGTKDFSLLSKLRGKTMITKDADTLLKNPDKEKILSELRDIYDGTSSAKYKNGIERNATATITSMLLCGTETLRELDENDAGQRYLDCVVMREIDTDLERMIMRKMFQTQVANLGQKKTADAESQDNPLVIHAKRLTGGYVQHLRRNDAAIYGSVHVPDALCDQLFDLSRFVAYMRARPGDQKEEYVQREMAGRIQNQLLKLAVATAAVMNKSSIDTEVVRRIRRVVLDTGRGNTLTIVDKIVNLGEDTGLDTRSVHISVGLKKQRIDILLPYLQKLGVLSAYRPGKGVLARTNMIRWRLTDEFRTIYNNVISSEREDVER